MFPIIRVIGSLNIDYTTTTAYFPAAGETITAKSLSINAGGKGANQAVACGRASYTSSSSTERDVQIEMVGAVGAKDIQFQALLSPVLKDAGIDITGVIEAEGAQTGAATIIVDEGNGGENRILVVPGANHDGMSDVEEVVKRTLKEPFPEVFVLQGEIPQETTFALLKAISETMRTAGKMVEVVFNPAPVYRGGIPVDCMRCVTHLVVNETEMGQLAVAAGDQYTAAKTEKDKLAALHTAATIFHQRLVRNVVITRGAQGVFCSTPEGSFWYEAAKVKNVVDTTAAGDTFVGYYAVGLARQKARSKEIATKKTLEVACRQAILAAAQCVERKGAIESIPWGYEIGK